jgi:hypothetical protein
MATKKTPVTLGKEIPSYIPSFIIIGLGILSVASGILTIIVNAVLQTEPNTYRPAFTTSNYELVSGINNTTSLYIKTDSQAPGGSPFQGISIVEAVKEQGDFLYVSLPTLVTMSEQSFAVIDLGANTNPYCVGLFVRNTYEPNITKVIAEVPPSTKTPAQCEGVNFSSLNQ